MNASALKINMSMKKAWWFQPLLQLMLWLLIYRLIPPSIVTSFVNWFVPYAFKFKLGNGKWRRIIKREDFKISFEKTRKNRKKGLTNGCFSRLKG